MKFLRGIISDRIRSGTLPPDVRIQYERPVRESDFPKADLIKTGEGHGLGKGATRRRGGDES